MFYEGNNRIYLAGPAFILSDAQLTMETASSEWAAKYLIPNQANGYVLGKFVEADKANNNKQYFRMGDLLMSQPTISYAPLNINHDARNIIGSFIASEMQYPIEADGNPHVEALAAMWKFYFPEAYDLAQRAFAQGSLFYSMEAVPRTISTIGGSDDEKSYAYEGRVSPNYPTEINERSCEAIVLNNPHFVGGALIVPPARPGWSNADIKQISKFVNEQWESAEAIYEGVQQIAPNAEVQAWEHMMGELIKLATDDKNKAKKKKGKAKPTDKEVPGY